MKDIFLKISGHKDEKSFYLEFPDEQSFMKKHGEAFKKAQIGGTFNSSTWNAINTGMEEMNLLDKYKFIPGTFASNELPEYEQPTNTKNDYSYLKQASTANTFSSKEKPPVNWAQGIPLLGNVVKGIQQLKEEKKELAKARQWEGVSDVMADAARMKGEPIRRKYLRPEDNINTGEEFFPIYGVGTNPLAKHGTVVAGNGFMSALGDFNNNKGNEYLNSIATELSGGESAGSTFGGIAGDVVGMIPGIGPIAKTLAKPILSTIGNLIDTNPEKTKKAKSNMDRNLIQAAFSNMPSNAYMRTGGSIGQNVMDGDLQVLWGGDIKPISNDVSIIDGNYHNESDGNGNKGVGIAYGDNVIEAQNNESLKKIGNNIVIYGGLTVPKEITNMIGEGKSTFQKLAKKIAKEDSKWDRILEKTANDITPIANSMDRLKDNSKSMMKLGAMMNKDSNNMKLNILASVQEEMNIIADQKKKDADKLFNKNKIAQDGYVSRYGLIPWEGNTKLSPTGKATASTYTAQQWDEIADNLGFKGKGNKEFQEFLMTDPRTKEVVKKRHQELYHKDPFIDSKLGYGYAAPELANVARNTAPIQYLSPKGIEGVKSLDLSKMKREPLPIDEGEEQNTDYWNTAMTAIGSLMPYLRPSDVETLDPRQLSGEMLALTDHVEPVQSQLYHPELGVPYDISLQDILNENRASTKAAQRLTANNPAAQAIIAAQEYGANEKVLGEQFRLNQAMKDRVYSENRNTLNQAQLTNLEILDRQYERQETAKSKTKANIQSALNSISSKYLQNQLENRTLATYENLYNYRFDPKFRAWNYNPPATFDIEGAYDQPLSNIPSDKEVIYRKNSQGEYEPYDIAKVTAKKKTTPAKNGDILKMIKNL